MAKSISLKLTFLIIFIGLMVLATACNAVTNKTTASSEPSTSIASFNPTDIPTKTLPPTPTADTFPPATAPLLFPDQGIILLDHYYHFQRVYESIEEPTYYQGVIFSPYVPEETITAPVGFWLVVTFADGTKEELQYIGLAESNQVIYRFTRHDNPRAGIMMAAHDVDGGVRLVIYLLVSEQL